MAACTVREIDTPQLAGPSSLARTLIMTADRDTLLQDGLQEAAISIRAQVQPGQSENVRLRAQVFVDGVAQDFGTLSNKNPITPTTIFFRAPPASTAAGGQVPTTVTIAVTPEDQGDFRSEFTRTLDLRLVPPGVILPSNPNLFADFTFTPAAPRVFDIVTFDASPTMNGEVACRTNCSYRWNFGDNTSAEGMIVAHQYRSVASFPVTLTVTDLRGAQAIAIKPVPVGPGEPPTAAFTVSPSDPRPGQAVFFNAGESKAAPGRVLVEFLWDFGDGTTASGATASRTYSDEGTRVVTLKVTDDAGSFTIVSQPVTVAVPDP
jgi:chitodextrinase